MILVGQGRGVEKWQRRALKVFKRFVAPSKRAFNNFLRGVFWCRHWSRGGAAAGVDDL